MSERTTPRPMIDAPNYRGLYGGLAVVAVAVTGGPIYQDPDGSFDYASIWELFTIPGRVGLGMMSVILLGALVILSAVATVRGGASRAIPIALAAVALVVAILLMSGFGASRTSPYEFATAGAMMLATAWGAVILGIVHVIHLGVLRRASRNDVHNRTYGR